MSTTKHTTIEQLKKLALRTKNEIGLVDAKVAGLTTKVNDLVTAGGISENKTAIADLKTLVGTLPEGATSTTIVAYITEAINALSIGDYAKTTEVTAAISTALESYYTKTKVDETFVKKTDIVMATDEEVDAMLTEVFGAQATV